MNIHISASETSESHTQVDRVFVAKIIFARTFCDSLEKQPDDKSIFLSSPLTNIKTKIQMEKELLLMTNTSK